ncbi:MAG TPA: tRNA (adenosine(37)-N6)-dimethylallyltransferase MiaA [Spirochaetota bacterium]|nr:tRNA (adenosine(37)-N6)-dimethylallyltransferase MiaA [Spirochaetota bacterium]HQE59542.1 tRNA (adenosine(37)-N6)-dimethylallyltransferase MiaA [Spirochaetota bacterium]
MRKIIVLSGATASGKSRAAMHLCEIFPDTFEIVSADSIQIYRYLDIGSSKPYKADLQKIRHHLIDIVDPSFPYKASDFVADAFSASEDIISRGKIPLFVGGSGMYLEAFFEGLSVTPEASSSIIQEIQNEGSLRGWDSMHEELMEIDPDAAKKIHSNDWQRITRALSVFRASGRRISEYWGKRTPRISGDFLFIRLEAEREKLYDVINCRVDQMIEKGFVDEVIKLLSMGYDEKCASMNSIGYSQIIKYLKGELSLDYAVEMIKHDTRRYAKKQIIWMRRKDYYLPFDIRDYSGISEKVSKFIK